MVPSVEGPVFALRPWLFRLVGIFAWYQPTWPHLENRSGVIVVTEPTMSESSMLAPLLSIAGRPPAPQAFCCGLHDTVHPQVEELLKRV